MNGNLNEASTLHRPTRRPAFVIAQCLHKLGSSSSGIIPIVGIVSGNCGQYLTEGQWMQ